MEFFLKKCYLNKRVDWEHILEEKKCHAMVPLRGGGERCVYLTHTSQKPCSTTAMAVYAIYESTAKELEFASENLASPPFLGYNGKTWYTVDPC